MGAFPAVDKNSASSETLSYDEKGNLLDDGTNAYAWDAEDRLIQITYAGTGNNTQFAYDPMDRCVQIQENGSTPSYSGIATKNFIWCGSERCEERDSSNAVVSRFCGLGQATSGSNYFYAFDHLGSVREVTDSSGNVLAVFGFDPYGNKSVLSGTFKPAFGFTGIYQHSRTNLALTWFRQYNPSLGRWLSRDPLGESAGLNLYGYSGNNPINMVDSLGLECKCNLSPDLSMIIRQMQTVIGDAGQIGNGTTGSEFGGAVGYGNSDLAYVTGSMGWIATPVFETTEITRKNPSSWTNFPNAIGNLWSRQGISSPVSVWHSHPTINGMGSGVFSIEDLQQANNWGVTSYILAPNGEVRRYIGGTKDNRALTENDRLGTYVGKFDGFNFSPDSSMCGK